MVKRPYFLSTEEFWSFDFTKVNNADVSSPLYSETIGNETYYLRLLSQTELRPLGIGIFYIDSKDMTNMPSPLLYFDAICDIRDNPKTYLNSPILVEKWNKGMDELARLIKIKEIDYEEE